MFKLRVDVSSDQRVFPVVNLSGDEVPAYGVMLMTGLYDGAIAITKPIADDMEPAVLLVNGPGVIPDGKRGTGTFDGPMIVLYETSDGTPAAYEEWGTALSSWTLHKNKVGFVAISVVQTGYVLAVNRYRSAIGVMCVGTNVVATFPAVSAPSPSVDDPGSLSDPPVFMLEVSGESAFEDTLASNVAENLEYVKYIAETSGSANDATGSTNVPKLQIEGDQYWVEIAGATDKMLLDSSIPITGPFTAYGITNRVTSTVMILLSSNAGTALALTVLSDNNVYFQVDSGAYIAAPYVGDNSVPAIWRLRRDGSDIVRWKASGQAEIIVGTQSGTVTFDTILARPTYNFSAAGNRCNSIYLFDSYISDADIVDFESYLLDRTGLSMTSPTLADLGTLVAHHKVESGRVWKDTAGTTPATADGDSVKRIDAIVGSPLIWTSGTAPILRISGTRWGVEWAGGEKLKHSSAVVSGSAAFSTFLVTTYGAAAGAYRFPLWIGTETVGTGYGLGYRIPAGTIESALYGGGGAVTGAGPSSGDRSIVEMGYAGGASGAHAVLRDGVSLGTSTMTANLGAGLCLGDLPSGGVAYYGQIHEIAIYSSNLSAATRAKVRNALKSVWSTL